MISLHHKSSFTYRLQLRFLVYTFSDSKLHISCKNETKKNVEPTHSELSICRSISIAYSRIVGYIFYTLVSLQFLIQFISS